MTYSIHYFEDDKGVVPVKEFIKNLTIKEQAKISAYLTYLMEVGPQMRRPMADYLGDATGLYEIRPGKNRVIYFFLDRKKIILLHGFVKKSKKISDNDITLANSRKTNCQVLKRYKMLDFDDFKS